MKMKWMWCDLCDCATVICPKCGNNCCNGGYGKIDGKQCTMCKEAYKYQDNAFKNNTNPKKEDCEEKIKDVMEDYFG